MSWDYFMVPAVEGTRFSESFLREAREYWKDEPTYDRWDGALVVCPSTAYRDTVVRAGEQDRPGGGVQVLLFTPENIIFGVIGHDQINIKFKRFMDWIAERVSVRILDEGGKTVSADEFLRRQLSVNGNRN